MKAMSVTASIIYSSRVLLSTYNLPSMYIAPYAGQGKMASRQQSGVCCYWEFAPVLVLIIAARRDRYAHAVRRFDDKAGRSMHAASPEENKRALRARMLQQRGMIAPEEAVERGTSAQAHVLASPHWASARIVALYMPIRGELDTGLLRSRAWAEGKRVLLPRCVVGRRGELELAACASAAELAPGSYGILEPLPALPAIDLEDPRQAPHLLIAPCLAVDRRGYRLGYGGGYYDRLLRRPALQTTVCIGLLYAVQRVVALPVASWDARLDGVCTEEGCTWV